MILYGGVNDIGYNREINEDFIHVKEIDKNIIFSIVADGAGSISSKFQPASLASLHIESIIERVYLNSSDALEEYPDIFLKEAFNAAGRALGIFRVVDEEKYAGFGASVSCALIINNKIIVAHTGNTRINLIRKSTKHDGFDCLQLTKDQTKGMELVDNKKMSFAEYHLSVERLQVTGGLGLAAVPDVQTFATTLKENDFVLLTTDGIHDAIRPEIFFEFIKNSSNCEDAVKALVNAAKMEKYEDNMAGILLWNKGD